MMSSVGPAFSRAVVFTCLCAISVASCSPTRGSTSAAQSDASVDALAIRAARAAQNRAIVAGDTAEMARYWTQDVEIRRGLGALVVGRDAYARLFAANDSASSQPEDATVIYQREPSAVDVGTKWPLAFETGTWAGHLDSATGPAVIGGRYSAQWVKRDSRWFIRGEVYVALFCAGAGCAYAAAP